jgi:hypothetical protein
LFCLYVRSPEFAKGKILIGLAQRLKSVRQAHYNNKMMDGKISAKSAPFRPISARGYIEFQSCIQIVFTLRTNFENIIKTIEYSGADRENRFSLFFEREGTEHGGAFEQES